jgi:hypothetical protein
MIQTLAEPLFYRALDLSSPDKLAFGIHEIGMTALRGKNVKNWIRRLTMHEYDVPPTEVSAWTHHAAKIIKYPANLEHLDIKAYSTFVVSHIVADASSSVERIDLELCEEGQPFWDVSLANFASLRTLTIIMRHSSWEQEERTLFTACTLPNLSCLVWHGFSCTGIFNFLAFSKFGSLDDVDIRDASPLTPTTTQQLSVFLRKNVLTRLTLHLEKDDELTHILPNVNTSRLILMIGRLESLPLPFVIAFFPPCVKTLMVLRTGNGENLWNLLEKLKTNENCHLKTIRILAITPEKLFYWVSNRDGAPTDNDKDDSAFLGNMLTYAGALAPRGIEIRDFNGMTVSDYFE